MGYLLEKPTSTRGVLDFRQTPMSTVVSDEAKDGLRTITMTRSSQTQYDMFSAGDLEVICARSMPITGYAAMELSYHGTDVGAGVLTLSEESYADSGSSGGGSRGSGGKGGGSSGGKGGGGGSSRGGGGKGGSAQSQLSVETLGAWTHAQRDLSTLYMVLFASLVLAAGFALWRWNRCVSTKEKTNEADDSQPLLSA